MRNILFSITFLLFTTAQAQVAIGRDKATNEHVSLEFSTAQNRGLILPYNQNLSNITVDGSFVFDTSDKKVKYLKGGNWFDLSVDDTGKVDLTDQNAKIENPTAKVGIGEPTAVEGILVLEDADKAMILPRVASPHMNIINPSPGMLVYDTDTHLLAVYNGTVWSYWKPE